MLNIIPHPTSLSTLSDHDWHILRSRWMRGQDWYVAKVGKRHWEITCFPTANAGFPLFKTKTAAERAASNLILVEGHYRAAIAHGLPTYN